MRNVTDLLCTLGSLALLSACTQPAAQVDNRGDNFYGKNGSKSNLNAASKPYQPSYINNRESYSAPVANHITYDNNVSSTAPISSISTKELSAPAPTAPRNVWNKPSASNAPTSFIKPVEGKVAAGYGKRSNGLGNDGISYTAPLGEPVVASAGGEIAYVGDELKSYGNMVIIKHENNYNTAYSHLGRTVVAKGSHVKQGQIIGYVGQTGDVSEPELHFALRKGTQTINPEQYLSKQFAEK
jgi:murein DD-endopeptidase MepM/ murein hydrolase activator NlpD